MSYLRLLFDKFTLALIVVVATASLFPVHGTAVPLFDWITTAAIAALFFLHGAKLSRTAIVAGASHWRLHLLVFSCTFVLFPLLGWSLRPMLEPMLGTSLYVGVLYLCALPGTVQSAIAFTSIARGNVAAAVCAASASSIVGIFVTPLLLSVLLNTNGNAIHAGDAIGHIVMQILVPFIVGHLLQPLVGAWVGRNRRWLVAVDQGSILLVVFTAFSASVVGGLWQTVPMKALVLLGISCCVMLAIALFATTLLARRLRFNTEDEITIVFCGSKKSMATGVPMAQVLFAGAAVGPVLLPLMIFHQIQLMVCAVLAHRYAQRADTTSASAIDGELHLPTRGSSTGIAR